MFCNLLTKVDKALKSKGFYFSLWLVKAVVLAQVDPFVPQFTPQFVVPMVRHIQTNVKLEIR